MFCVILYVLSSDISPEGRSILTTVLVEAFMYFTSEANPPLNGLFVPEPNRPSITSVSESSVGGSNSSVTSTKRFICFESRRRVRFALQSSLSVPFTLKRYAVTSYFFSDNMRATARASPPLFPGPANTTTGFFTPHLLMIACVRTVAERSIRSIEDTGSCSMVNLSNSRI